MPSSIQNKKNIRSYCNRHNEIENISIMDILKNPILYILNLVITNVFCLHPAIQRDTPDEDLKPEDFQQFKSLGSACLTEGDSAQLQKFLEDEKNQVFLLHH